MLWHDESETAVGARDAMVDRRAVDCLPRNREVLERPVRVHSTPQQLALGARIILQAADAVGTPPRDA